METLSGICTFFFICMVLIWAVPIVIKVVEKFQAMNTPVFPTHRRSPYWDVLASQMSAQHQPEPEPEKKSLLSGKNIATGLSIGVSLLRLFGGIPHHHGHHKHH